MEHRQLKYFLAAQECLSFTEAAQQLHISQSTLSQQIKQLEIALNAPLFNRIGRQITLTDAGKLFTEYARASVRKAEEGLQVIRDLNNMNSGTVAVGVASGLKDFFTQVLIQFATQFPGIDIRVVYEPSHLLFEKLNRFELDFILAFHEMPAVPHLTYKHLFKSPMVLVAAPKSAIAKKKKVSLQEISSLPLAIATKGYSTSHIISKNFSRHGLDPRFSIEVNDIPTVLELVKTGKWYSILVKSSVSDPKLVSVAIDEDGLTRTTNIVSLRDAYETKAVKAFRKLLVEAGAQL